MGIGRSTVYKLLKTEKFRYKSIDFYDVASKIRFLRGN
jgi:hypothetical protein